MHDPLTKLHLLKKKKKKSNVKGNRWGESVGKLYANEHLALLDLNRAFDKQRLRSIMQSVCGCPLWSM